MNSKTLEYVILDNEKFIVWLDGYGSIVRTYGRDHAEFNPFDICWGGPQCSIIWIADKENETIHYISEVEIYKGHFPSPLKRPMSLYIDYSDSAVYIGLEGDLDQDPPSIICVQCDTENPPVREVMHVPLFLT